MDACRCRGTRPGGGDPWPCRARLSGLPTGFEARAAEDTVCCRIPIVDLARWAGMAAGAASGSTAERLSAAEAAGTLEGPDVRTLIEAFGFIFSLRLDHQVEQLRRAETPDDFIDPKS